jgi:Ca2+/Na+ antiporter
MFSIALILIQASDRLSWKVWAAAAFFLLLGIVLFVYFLTRLRKSEQEPEEWSLSRSSLFVAESSSESIAACPACRQPVGQQARLCQSCGFDLTKAAGESPAQAPRTSQQAPKGGVNFDQAHGQEALSQAGATAGEQSLQEDFASPFGDEIWAELEKHQQAAQDDAWVEQRPQREPFEPPRIEALTPRQQQTQAATTQSRPPIESAVKHAKTPGSVLGLSAASDSAAQGSPEQVTKASGPVLQAGEPARKTSALPISTLSSYGGDESEKAGPWGTIALVTVVILIAIAVLAFLFVPSINSRVKAWVARVRSGGASPATPAPEKPKAQIISRSEVKQNRVRVKGAVLNRSSEALAGLFVEVALERSDGAPPDTRNAQVKPEQLAPLQQGSFELEYDAKQYSGYRIKRLINKDGSEIKFIAPSFAQ